MPTISQLQYRRYFISVSSHDGEVNYFSRRQLSFTTDSFGFLLVKADKPIYKPSQQGWLCIYQMLLHGVKSFLSSWIGFLLVKTDEPIYKVKPSQRGRLYYYYMHTQCCWKENLFLSSVLLNSLLWGIGIYCFHTNHRQVSLWCLNFLL